jgi:L-alanine-DL-glutamate epimerase-like enolase superfamily enzyme
MVVGHHALQRRDEPRPLAAVITEDVARVRAVREAVGPGVQLYVDANCSLDGYHALELARRLEPYDVALFEEPITHNDAPDGRSPPAGASPSPGERGACVPLRDLLVAQAVDVIQPNVTISGGFTQCQRIAGMAAAFNVPVANGGAWPHHNMHLHAGLANGTLVEYHHVAVLCCREIFDGLADPVDGWLALPQSPGLGFAPRADAVRELAKRPTSRGKGKA